MKRTLKYLAIAVGVLLLAVIALPFLVSVDAFRPIIEQRLSNSLGRKVEVGDLSLALFSGTLTAGNLSIADDPGFSQSPFLTAKSIKIGVELWPLITSKTVSITGITIEQPEVVLIRNAQGNWNFSTLAGATAKAASSKQSDRPGSAPAGGSAPEPADRGPREVTVDQVTLEDGRMLVRSATSKESRVYDNVDLEATNLSLTSQFPLHLAADLPGGGSFKLDGKVGPLNQGDATLSPLEADVRIGGLDLAKTGFLGPRASTAGIVDATAKVRSQNGVAHTQGSVTANKLQLARGASPSGVPLNVEFQLDYDLNRNAGVIKQGVVKIGDAVSHVGGTFQTRGESTVINLKVTGDKLPVQDLQAALPAFGVILPKGSSLETGTASVNLNAQGPLDNLVTTGNVGLSEAKLEGFDMASKMAALPVFSGLAKKTPDTSIQKLAADVRVTPDGTQLSNLQLLLPAIAQLTGGGTISADNALDLKMVATLSSQTGIVPALGNLAGRALAKDASIPFLIQGTKSEPKFMPDTQGVAKGLVKSQIEKTLGSNPKTKGLADALGGILGGKKKDK